MDASEAERQQRALSFRALIDLTDQPQDGIGLFRPANVHHHTAIAVSSIGNKIPDSGIDRQFLRIVTDLVKRTGASKA